MSLSKKNLDKLNKLKKNKNLNNESKNISNSTNIPNSDNLITNPLNSEDPNEIFYSLIDNSEFLEDTSNVNHSLRKSELNQINMNPRKANFSKKLIFLFLKLNSKEHSSTELNCFPSSLRQIIILLLDLRLFKLKVFNSLMISSGILFLY